MSEKTPTYIESLHEKWGEIIDHPDLPEITDRRRRDATAVLLENQEKALTEDRQMLAEAVPNSNTSNIANYDPVLIGLVRRSVPQLIAYDICGVQPMTMPTGLVFAMRTNYTDKNGAEALFNEPDANFSAGRSAATGTNPVDATTGVDPWDASPGYSGAHDTGRPGTDTAGLAVTGTGIGVSTAAAEDFGGATTFNEMTFTIEKQTVTAKSRALKAKFTIELQQDLKAVHGLDAEAELQNILATEIVSEINREVIRTVYGIAKTGAQLCATAGTFDLDVDSNGRWSQERFKGLLFQIERDANRIAQTTRRGKGNIIICSADVASALMMTGKLDYTPALASNGNLNVDDSSTTFAGILMGKYKVYIDPYAANGDANQFCVVGYRGSSPFDAGIFYAPYVPLQLLRAVDPATFQPSIGFKTRYGLVGHPLNGTTAQSNDSFALRAKSSFYFRLFRITNLS